MLAFLMVAVLGADSYPAAAMAKINEAVDAAKDARKLYYEKLDKVRRKLITDLEQQLEAATKRGDFDSATAIKKDLERLEKEDFITLMEDLLGNSSLLASSKKTWIGSWKVKIGPKFEGQWDVKEDGTVNKNGRWRFDLSRQKLRITWPNGGWEDVSLPLSPDLVRGVNREGLQVIGKKVE